jgi:RNA polymerase II-associated protein 3
LKKGGKAGDEIAAPVRSSGGTVAVRSTAASKPAKRAPAVHKAKAATTAGTSSTAASHTYDKGYKKWEKFDVDAALNNASDDEADSPNPAEEDTDAIDNSEQQQQHTAAPISSTTSTTTTAAAPTPASIVGNVPRRVTAPVPRALPRPAGLDPELEEREKGNAHFKAGSFAAAVKCYTRCLGMNPRSVAALSNRAMAQLKLGENRSAERDCTVALAVEPSHIKSLRRRAAARAALGKHRAALADLQLALSIEPGSKELQSEAARCREVMRSALKRCPKRRVPIQLEVLPAAQCSGSVSGSSSTAAAVAAVAMIEQQPAVAAAAVAEQSAVVAVSEQPAVLATNASVIDDGAVMTEAADSSSGTVNVGDCVHTKGSSADSTTAAVADATAVAPVASSAAVPGIATRPKLPAAPPKTAYELEREWRNLRDHPDLLCAYMRSFKSSTFKRVFRESLHADVISGLLKLLQQHIAPQQPAEAVRILQSLSKADSFSMLLLMLPADDRATLHSVFDVLSQQQHDPAIIQALRATFKIQ